MALDTALRYVGMAAWIICLAFLAPAVARLMLRRPRYLDPIWAVVFLLAVNRLSFLLRVSQELSHATAAVLAFVMAFIAWSYQRHDR